MSDHTLTVLLLIATYTLWVALPLFPAVLIYKLFPDTVVGLRGPLQGLTLSAGGAFAAYFATLLASLFFVNQIIGSIGNPPNAVWTLDGSLAVSDENGKMVPTPQSGVTVSLNPAPVTVDGDQLSASIAKNDTGWPKIRVDVAGYGAKTFSLDPNKVNFDVDEKRHRIKLNEPLVIRRPPPVVFSAGALATPAAPEAGQPAPGGKV